jgi:hypothetical protein
MRLMGVTSHRKYSFGAECRRGKQHRFRINGFGWKGKRGEGGTAGVGGDEKPSEVSVVERTDFIIGRWRSESHTADWRRGA